MSYSVCIFCKKGMRDYCGVHTGCAELAKDALVVARLNIRAFGCGDGNCDLPCGKATRETLAVIDEALGEKSSS